MSKVIVIGSQKGGVGKTTTTLNLAYSLCSMGKKVLAIDLDSQANLSTCYGIENTKDLEYTIGHLLMAQIEEEEPEFRARMEWILFLLLFIYLLWRRSLEQKWEQRECWQRYWRQSESDMIMCWWIRHLPLGCLLSMRWRQQMRWSLL